MKKNLENMHGLFENEDETRSFFRNSLTNLLYVLAGIGTGIIIKYIFF